jgi:hypothetical protein
LWKKLDSTSGENVKGENVKEERERGKGKGNAGIELRLETSLHNTGT